VGERMPIAGLIDMGKFYQGFIVNVDEYRGLKRLCKAKKRIFPLNF
jgi:hypothetical protein